MDNYNGVVTQLNPDTLECEVKQALRSITMNKASGGDGIPAELFQVLKDDAVKQLHSICKQIWKTQQWPQDWKSQFSFRSQRRAMLKNVQTTLHCGHFTCYQGAQNPSTRPQWYVNKEFPDIQAGFRKGRGTKDQIANFLWIIEKAREFQKNIYFCFIDYMKVFVRPPYLTP